MPSGAKPICRQRQIAPSGYLNEKNLADFELSTGISSSVRAADLDEIKQSPRWRVEATLLELHQSGEIIVVDDAGDASKARVKLKPDHVLRLPSQRSFSF